MFRGSGDDADVLVSNESHSTINENDVAIH